jgi:hypothetical protein
MKQAELTAAALRTLGAAEKQGWQQQQQQQQWKNSW